MAQIWKEEYATGISSIDRQHQKLFETISTLEDLLDHDSLESEEISLIIAFLNDYVTFHFKHEEFCMQLCDCANQCANQRGHRHFETYFKKWEQQFYSSDFSSRRKHLQDLLDVTQHWLKNHIVHVDLSLKKENDTKHLFDYCESKHHLITNDLTLRYN